MTKDKSLHLTPKQLGLEDNPMIKGGALNSDAGIENEPQKPLVIIAKTYVKSWDHHVMTDGAEAILAALDEAGYKIVRK